MTATALRLAPAVLAGIGFWFAVAYGVAADPRRALGFLTLCAVVFAFLPLVMAAAMASVAAVLFAVLSPVATIARVLTGRPTGFGPLLGGYLAASFAVVPGYVRALQKIRSLRIWGFVMGSYAALPALFLTLPAPT